MSAPSAVLVNRFYRPDVAATARLLTELAEGLAARGWQVTVIAGRVPYRGGGGRLPPRGDHGGVRVERVRSTGFGRGWLLGRAVDYGTFLLAAAWRLLVRGRADVIVAGSDPPLLHAVAAGAARLRGVPVVTWSQDVYPDVASAVGVFRGPGLLYRSLGALARAGWRKSDAVVVVGERMAERLAASGVDRSRLRTVPNWVDTDRIRPVPEDAAGFRAEHGLDGRFVVLYAGNAGRAHDFDALPGAAAALADEPDVVFVFVGGGARRPWLESEARRLGLDNVRFLDYQPEARLPAMLSAADVGLVTEAPEALGLVVPSKTYGVMAAGRPVVYVGPAESDVARLVEGVGCGVVVGPRDPEGLADAVRTLRRDPELCASLGARGRQAAVARFDRGPALDRWDALLRGVTGR